jgi:hypothetical protein
MIKKQMLKPKMKSVSHECEACVACAIFIPSVALMAFLDNR